MKCMNEEIVQKYIDNELFPQEREAVEEHLADCEKCAQLVEEQRAFSNMLKKGLCWIENTEVVVPEFVPAKSASKRKSHLKRYWAIASTAVAACALAAVLLFFTKEKERENAIVYYYRMDYVEIDANKSLDEQEVYFILYDENGNIVEF